MRMAEEIERAGQGCGLCQGQAPGQGGGDRLSAIVSTVPRTRAPGTCARVSSGCRRKWASRTGTRFCEAVVEAMAPYARHGVNVNVDFYSGVIYHLHGIAKDLFVPIFAIGRVPGWTAQCLEQLDRNILIRPLTLYDGPPPRDYVPRDRR